MAKKQVKLLLEQELKSKDNKTFVFKAHKITDKKGFEYITFSLADQNANFTFYEKYCFENIMGEDENENLVVIGKRAYSKEEIEQWINIMVEKRYPILDLDIKDIILRVLSQI